MPDWEILEKLWNQIFGNQAAIWLLRVLGTVATIWLAVWLVAQIIDLWKNIIWPVFYRYEEKRRNFRRRLFAEKLEYEINKINRDEREWEDYRFAELEAEIEAGGLHSTSSIIPFIKREYKGLRREKSLSNALKTSKESIILLEGDPGSGKSVALRHVALDLLRKAKRSLNNQTILPIYINFRGLKRSHNQLIDRELILNHILFSLNRANTRDTEMFLEDEFGRGLHEGTWLFLFDSFDEIPEILSARDADPIVRKYADAIFDFLHDMNRCRGIVASRYFRGPGHVDWPHFNIVGLSTERQIQLIKRARLSFQKEQLLIGQLASARSEIQAMVTNPLFLSMIIEHTLSGQEFPENTYTVFETYINRRFEQDKERIHRRFGLEFDKVKSVAEIIAFCMTSDSNIGLSPYRENIKEALNRLQLETTPDLDNYLDALEFIKIGRSESALSVGESKSFAFSHRRFQEYFATSFVMRAPDRASPSQLLTDARWRETAVVLCQTRSEEELQDLIFEAGENLYQYTLEVEAWYKSIEESGDTAPTSLRWPLGLLYLLSLLQDGFKHRRHVLPEYIRSNASFILQIAQSYGIFPDRKWSLEVAGIAQQPALLDALRTAIHDPSILLNQVAYEQVSKLEYIPEDVSIWIRKSLIEKAATFQLRKQRFTTQAFLSRLVNKDEFLRFLRLLLTLPTLDLLLHIISALIIILSARSKLNLSIGFTSFFGNIFVGVIGLAMPMVSYIFAYLFTDDEKSPMAIQPYALSFLARLTIPFIAFNFVDGTLIKVIVICLGYLLLVPISAIILIKDGFDWKSDLQVLSAPIQAMIYGAKQWVKKHGLSKLVKSFFVVIALVVGIWILFSNRLFDVFLVNPIWIMALYCLAMPGMFLTGIEVIKRRKIEKAKLKDDQQKLQLWNKELRQKRTGEEFFQLFKELETPKYMLFLINDISKNDILEKSEASELAIKSAIQYLEVKGITREQVPVVDEMCILLEHIQSAKEK